MALPVIDSSKFPDPQEYNKLRKTSEEWGCFMLVNHSIPMNLMLEMKMVARSLLDLPIEIKKKNTADAVAGLAGGGGYIAPTTLSSFHESLGLFDLGSAEDVHTFCSRLDASSYQRNVIEKYAAAIHEQIVAIGSQLVESYGLDSGFLKEWHCLLRMIKYNFTSDSVGACGFPSHSDSGFVTILQADENVGGLEVMDISSAFVPVQPSPAGTLLVFFGDSAKAWSNGRVRNVKHRVQCKEAVVRVSIASFIWGPKERAAVEAHPELVDSDHPRLYVPFSSEELRKLKSTNNGNDALEVMRIKSLVD